MTTLLERFLATKRSPNTRAAYRGDITAFLAKFGWGMLAYPDFCRISASRMSDQVGAFLAGVRKIDEHTGRVLNPQTWNRKRNALSSFFGYLVDWHRYPRNPVRIFRLLPTRRKSSTQGLNASEVRTILDHLQHIRDDRKTESSARDYLVVLFLFHYALRRSELVSLQWSDFHPRQGFFEVVQKGGEPRLKPLVNEDWAGLSEFRQRYPCDCPYVFHGVRRHPKTKRYHPLSPAYIFKMVTKVACEVLPYKHITPHSFRCSFVGIALDLGVDPVKIAHDGGWADLKMIGYYDPRDYQQDSAIAMVACHQGRAK
ncbi:Site-specific integrase [Sulfidibacter corallicola]|uniref:Site-specific integrase n=1 Tax=Sulfidibacter corallicola TaxID=2818388 RepID=A0A8A4TMR2_SULCO|nr:site-specific integrase [Sulfidibacter corallicola]QTD50737.1 site-specific integrase [Sulfidibacter corallicola]